MKKKALKKRPLSNTVWIQNRSHSLSTLNPGPNCLHYGYRQASKTFKISNFGAALVSCLFFSDKMMASGVYIDVELLSLKFFACGNFCRPLINFANNLDPDQGRQNVSPDLDPNCFDTLIVFLKEFFEKTADDQKKQEKLPSMLRLNDNHNLIFFYEYLHGFHQWLL